MGNPAGGKRSIRTMLILAFVAIIVADVGLTSTLSLASAHKALGQLAGELYNQITLQIQDHLNGYLALPHMVNQINLDNIELGLLDLDNPSALERYVWRQTRRFRQVGAITYADERAEYVGTTREAPDGPISLAVSGSATGHALEIYDTAGDGQRTTRRERYPDYDPRPRPWYQTALRQGAPAWTPIFVWTNGAIGTDAVAPVYWQDGILRGVLDVSLTLDGIAHYLRGLKVGKSGKTLIIERSGLIVASSEDEIPYVRSGEQVKRLSALESAVPLFRATAQALLDQSGSFAAIERSQQLYFEHEGRQFAQVTPFRDPYGLDWLIVVVVPEADFLAEINANRQTTLLLMAGLLLLGIALAVATAGWIARPVRRLNQSAKALAQSSWDAPVPGHYLIELDELAGSFNRMASQLRQTFASLRSNEQRLRETLEAARMGTWEWDITSGRMRWSELVDALFGLAPASFAGTQEAYLALIPDADRVAVLRGVADCLEGRSVNYAVEHRVIWPDGSMHWLEVNGQILFDADGAGRLMRGTIADITERKLLQLQLVQAQKMEAIGRLAGGIAHDFNNILTYMLGSCSLLLLDLPPDGMLRREVEEIQGAVNRAALLTRQLLAFSRQQALLPQSLDLNAVVANMAQLLGRLIGEDVTLKTSLDPQAGHVRADAGQLEQVVLNLAVNARDAMPAGGTLAIETSNVGFFPEQGLERVDGLPYVRLTVRDSGSGMDAATQMRMFDPFFTTKEPGKGTGLGLSTVHGIVTQSGGQILVESVVNGGTTFKLYLPREDEPPASHATQGERPAGARGRGRILLVEDEQAVRELAARLLRQAGYEVLEADSGPMALELLAARQPAIDLLLTDVVMPGGMSGFELAAQVRALQPGAGVLYISGYAQPSQEQVPADLDLLQKPFGPGDLLARVARAMGHG